MKWLLLSSYNCLSPVERMEESREMKLMYVQKMKETRQRWRDSIEEDVQEVGVTVWRD